MKKLLYRVQRRAVSSVLALSMAFGFCYEAFPKTKQVSADGASTESVADDGVINYVSIGDSMTNGYGFAGYRQGGYQVGDSFQEGDGVYGDASYANQFADWLDGLDERTVEHDKLASSALRAEDLLYLLGGRDMPTDGWFNQVLHYTGVGAPNEGEDYVSILTEEELKEYYVESVVEADIISLCIGNASFGAYLVQYVTGVIGVMGATLPENEIVTLEDALVLVEDEEAKEIVLEVYDMLLDELYEVVSEELAVKYSLDKVADVVAYCAAGFMVNYLGVIEKIIELNPDVEIVLLGLMNTTHGLTITNGDAKINIGDIMDETFGLLNTYVAGVPTALKLAKKTEDVKFYYAEQPTPEYIAQEFDDLANAGWADVDRLSGEVVRSRTIESFNGSLRGMIGAGFGMELPVITLNDIKEFESNPPSWVGVAPILTYDDGKYVFNVDMENNPTDVFNYFDPSVKTDVKNLTIAIYLGIEDAIVASTDTMEVPLDALLNIASVDALQGTLTGFMPNLTPELISANLYANHPYAGLVSVDLGYPLPYFATEIDTACKIRNDLGGYFTSTPTLKAMCMIYALFKVGNGMSVHPIPRTHDAIFNAMVKSYTEGYMAEDKVLEEAETAAKYLVELAKQYGPVIAEKAYEYAVEEGYVAYVENVIDDVKAEYVALKAELKAMRQELVAYANSLVPTPKARTAAPKASTLVEEVNATIQCIDAQIAAIDAMIAQLPGMAEEFVKEIATALYNQATYQVEVCLNKLNAKLNALMVKVENAVAAVEAKCIETKNAILAKVAEVEAAAQAQYLAVVAKIEATVAEVKAIVAEIENQINLAYQAAYEVYMGGYVVKHERAEGEEIFYLAIGDAAVNGYVNKVAEAWNASAASINNAGTVADLIAALNDAANIEAIENADVISLGFTNNAMVNFVVNQIKASIGWYGATYVELDWASLVTEDGVVYVEKALDTLSAELVKADLGDIALSNVNVSIADILSIAIESYVYKYLEFNLGYYEAANTIAAINPDASILMVGMYNPFKGLVVNNIAIGDYVEYMVDIMDLQYTAYAWVMPNVAFVDISDVAPNATYETFEYDFIDILINESSDKLLPTADSYDYIADQIVKAVEFVEVEGETPVEPEVPDHEHSYTVKYDENNHWLECECGDKKDVEEHDFDADGKCDCGYETEVEPEVPDHEHSYTVKYDENSHWLECECGDKKDVEAHDFDADGKCDCGYETEVEPENPPVNPEDPEDPEEPKEEPKEEDTISAGAVVGITLASTAVVGASGFSVVWFAVMKKSGADLAIAVKGAAKTAGSAVKNGCGKAIKAIKKLFRK